MANEVALQVNGLAFGGWTRVRVTRSIESIAGSFELSVSDRWGTQNKSWLIREEDICRLTIGGRTVITGYVDRRSISYGAQEHSLTVSGRDKTGALVDCSALPTGKSWDFIQTPVLTVAKRICAPFGITNVFLQSGIKLPQTPARQTIDPGESAFEVIEKACRMAGVLPVSDGLGGLFLTQAGSTTAHDDLVEGQNILRASADYDASGRYARYVVTGQHPGVDEDFGLGAAGVRGEARDTEVVRTDRVLMVRAENLSTIAHAKRRAAWEKTVRQARGGHVSITVHGWTMGDGNLWPINALVKIKSPLLGLDAQMLITQATYALDDSGGMTTQMTLRHPDAYTPEPKIPRPAPWLGKVNSSLTSTNK